MPSRILIVEPDSNAQATLVETLVKYEIVTAANAPQAIEMADEQGIDMVIMEMSLAGHSGMEFLYEFRTYTDWIDVPVVVFSSVKLDRDITDSRTWEQLNVASYLYKPSTSLEKLKSVVDKLFEP